MADDARKKEILEKLRNGVIQYDEDACREGANEAVAEGLDANEAIFDGLVSGMQEVGRLFEAQEYFVPEIASDPRDPSLTPEQRTTIIKRHAALRNRAAPFGALNLTVERLEAKLAEAEKKLKQYESSVPKTDGSEPATTTAQSGSAWDAFNQRLQQYAK